jgi:hypothetical protein
VGTKFAAGQHVKWASTTSAHCFHGTIVSRLGDKHYLVADRTGLRPRIVTARRLQSATVYTAFGATVA